MNRVHLPLAAFVLLLFGCPAEAPEPRGASRAAPANAVADADQTFIDGMVPHHEGAVAMAKIALDRAEHPELRAMAQDIVSSQQAEIKQMTGWRKAWFGSDAIPAMGAPMSPAMPEMPGMPMHGNELPGMNSMMQMPAQIEALKTATPFDLAFLDVMIPHHEAALPMSTWAQGKTSRSEIKDLAAKIFTAQTKEIAQMQEWRGAWFPDAPAPASDALMGGAGGKP